MWTSELSALPQLRSVGLIAIGAFVFVLAHRVAATPGALAPRYGARGKRRMRARGSLLFCAAEPLLSKVAGLLATQRKRTLHSWLRQQIRYADEPLGLCPNELLALAVLSCALVGVCSAWLVHQAGMGVQAVALMLLLGGYLPLGRVRALAKQRAKQLERSLPVAMDLCVLCMGAGADFPGALRFVVGELGPLHQVCREELGQVLDELALGRTRVEALQALGSRTGSVAVREFVASVCQSEEKGTPMIEALTIQSTTLRQRRTVRAEELAAQAGVKMMLPLMLLVCSLLLIVFGPIITTGMGL
jgi:tight adherence protein C